MCRRSSMPGSKAIAARCDLPDEDVAEIPTFIMFRRMLLIAWIGSHAETDLAQSMGVPYTNDTVALAEDYLKKFG